MYIDRLRHNIELTLDLVISRREYKKTLKLERKLENKLEKLEHKTWKIKAKKLALGGRPHVTDCSRSNIKSRPVGLPVSSVDFLMDARPVNNMNLAIPHMNGGETYKHSWEVYNSGKLTWTSEVYYLIIFCLTF